MTAHQIRASTTELRGYSCLCRLGFEGDDCERNIDECESNPCYHDSACIDGINMYSCHCRNGFAGARCDVSVEGLWNAGTVSGAIVGSLVIGILLGFLTAYLLFRYHSVQSIKKSLVEKRSEQIAMNQSPAYHQPENIYASPTYDYINSISNL